MSEKNLNFKLLVFDWDGTLMDSAPRIVASFQTAITELGLEKRSNAQIRHIIGLGLETAIATLFPGESPQHCVQLSERYRHHFLSNQALATPLFPGVAETLHTLHAAGYWLAVATSKSRKGLNRALAQMAQKAGTASGAVSYGVHDKALLLACNPLICSNELPALSAWLHSAQGTPCTIIGNKPDVRDTIG
jgi:phosphoglycolate phosphatase